MKKLLATLAMAGLAGGAFAGTALASDDHILETPAGDLESDGSSYLIGQGNGDVTPDGYIGVDSTNLIVAGCGEYDHGNNSQAFDPSALGDSECVG